MNEKIEFVFMGAFDEEYALYRVCPLERYIVVRPNEEEGRQFKVYSNFLCPLRWMDEGLYLDDGQDRYKDIDVASQRIISKNRDEIFETVKKTEEPSDEIVKMQRDVLKNAEGKERAIIVW